MVVVCLAVMCGVLLLFFLCFVVVTVAAAVVIVLFVMFLSLHKHFRSIFTQTNLTPQIPQ